MQIDKSELHTKRLKSDEKVKQIEIMIEMSAGVSGRGFEMSEGVREGFLTRERDPRKRKRMREEVST